MTGFLTFLDGVKAFNQLSVTTSNSLCEITPGEFRCRERLDFVDFGVVATLNANFPEPFPLFLEPLRLELLFLEPLELRETALNLRESRGEREKREFDLGEQESKGLDEDFLRCEDLSIWNELEMEECVEGMMRD